MQVNPKGMRTGEWRVNRGGSWDYENRSSQAAYRNRRLLKHMDHGFRVVMGVKQDANQS